MGIYEELQWRGLIKDVSSPEIKEKLNKSGKNNKKDCKNHGYCIDAYSGFADKGWKT